MKVFSVLFLLILVLSGICSAARVITGRVMDYYGAVPISQTRILAIDVNGEEAATFETVSTAGGTFTLSVPKSRYIVAANPNGTDTNYLPEYYPGVLSSAYAEIIDVGDANVEGIDFYLSSGFQVTGELGGVWSAGMTGTLLIYDNGMWRFYYDATGASIDPQTGNFSIHLPQGTYHFYYFTDSYDLCGGTFSVPVNNNLEGISIETLRTGSIRGRVIEPDGDPCYYAVVTAIDADNGYYLGYAFTQGDGSYAISGLEGDVDYLLSATVYINDFDYSAVFYPEVTAPEDATHVHLPTGMNLTGMQITLTAQHCSISGLVTDTSGLPIVGATVYDFYLSPALNLVQPFSQRIAVTGDDGRYTLEDLAPVTVGLAAIADGHVPQIWQGHNQTTTIASADPVTLRNGDALTGMDFQLRPTASLAEGPAISSIRPFLLLPGSDYEMVLKGDSFAAANVRVEILDEYYFHTPGLPVTLSNVRVISDGEIRFSLQTLPDAMPQPLYITVTNPDGQYAMVGIALIDEPSDPEIGIVSAPHELPAGCTLTVGLDVVNLTSDPRIADIYLCLVLPNGAAYFYDGMTFSTQTCTVSDGVSLAAGFYLPTTTLLEWPIEQNLPPGIYSWFAALMLPGSTQIMDLSMVDQVALF